MCSVKLVLEVADKYFFWLQKQIRNREQKQKQEGRRQKQKLGPSEEGA
jgi:hypothetical protein